MENTFPGDGTAAQVFCIQSGKANGFAVHRHAFALGVEHQSADGDLRFLYLHRAQLGIAAQLVFTRATSSDGLNGFVM